MTQRSFHEQTRPSRWLVRTLWTQQATRHRQVSSVLTFQRKLGDNKIENVCFNLFLYDPLCIFVKKENMHLPRPNRPCSPWVKSVGLGFMAVVCRCCPQQPLLRNTPQHCAMHVAWLPHVPPTSELRDILCSQPRMWPTAQPTW